jgi:hypothetical protein
MPGMTATANIVVAQQTNALMVSNRAVKTQGNRRVITLLSEGKEIPLVVKTGLSNDTNIQIMSASTLDGQAVALQDGDTVVINATTTTGGNTRGAASGNPLGALTGLGGGR